MPTVLIDPSGYQCRNLGDLAMLQVAVARWRELWPSASIAVMTEAPEALAASVPHVIPVEVRDRSVWLNTHLLGRLHQRLPRGAAATLEQAEHTLKMKAARPLEAALTLRCRAAGKDASGIAAFLHWIRRADVVAMSGNGTFTDAFSGKVSHLLDTFGMALTRASGHGLPVTAIFGCGLGPLDDPALRVKAAGILPRIDFIAIREDRSSRPLLDQLGVRDDRIFLTGDDAIELAYDQQPRALGRALGINVRLALYANTDASMLEVVKEAAASATRRYGAEVVPVPILRHRTETQSNNAGQADDVAIRELLAGISNPSSDLGGPDSPAAVIRVIGRCRVVITGSYHAGVFALAQGIPAIGLARSPYYRAKFSGLAGQFEGGVQVVEMSEPGWGQQLEMAIDIAWQTAERVRPRLLEAAKCQIELSRRAYRTVASLAESRIVAGRATRP
jgi:polysaccharide pyruvyl transferase WcaK-like protein